jgi:hypothetical protein
MDQSCGTVKKLADRKVYKHLLKRPKGHLWPMTKACGFMRNVKKGFPMPDSATTDPTPDRADPHLDKGMPPREDVRSAQLRYPDQTTIKSIVTGSGRAATESGIAQERTGIASSEHSRHRPSATWLLIAKMGTRNTTANRTIGSTGYDRKIGP